MKKITNIHLNRFLDVLNVLSLILFPLIFYYCLVIGNRMTSFMDMEFFPGQISNENDLLLGSFLTMAFLCVYVLLTMWKDKRNLWTLLLGANVIIGNLVTMLHDRAYDPFEPIANNGEAILRKFYACFFPILEVVFLILIVVGLVYMVKFKVQDLKQIKVEHQERKASKQEQSMSNN